MFKKVDKNANRIARHQRVRKTVKGTPERPRLNVYRSTSNIYVQIVDDINRITLVSASTIDKEINGRTAASLFQEYAISLKGARQLVWSRGLKALLLIEEKTDEELAQQTEQEAIKLRDVDNFIFGLLCHYQLRHEFLSCLERDYENGCFGCGEAERLLINMLELDINSIKAL